VAFEEILAVMTAGTPSMEPSSGGIPEITASDVAAAMGYAEGKEQSKGVHLMLAKYCDDAVSRAMLTRWIPLESYMIWWKITPDIKTSVKINYKTAQVALEDFLNPIYAKGKGDVFIRSEIGLGYKSWNAGHRYHYAEIQTLLSDLVTPVRRQVKRFMRKEHELAS